jgi:hypothetical protein
MNSIAPQEKAKELLKKAQNCQWVDAEYGMDDTTAKNVALFAVDEILNSNPRYPNNVDWDDAGGTHAHYYEAQFEESEKYWLEVKQEIEKQMSKEFDEFMDGVKNNHPVEANEMINHIVDTNKMVEISDEEINKEAKNHHNYYEFIAGAKWYREQLKNK